MGFYGKAVAGKTKSDAMYKGMLAALYNFSNDGESRSNLWAMPKCSAKRLTRGTESGTSNVPVNPCQKPWRLYHKLIEHFSVAGDHVLDLCSGTGRAAVACLLSNRDCTSVENNAFQILQANFRIEELQSAIKDDTKDANGRMLTDGKEYH